MTERGGRDVRKPGKKEEELTEEAIIEWLARTPQRPESREFRDRVMRDVRRRRPHGWGRLAGPGVTLAAGFLCGFLTAVVTQRPDEASAATKKPVSLVSFDFYSADAKQVELVGDFTGWERRLPLRRRSGQQWTVAVPLESGEYEYQFIKDANRRMSDPQAALYRADRFGNRNSVVRVSRASNDRTLMRGSSLCQISTLAGMAGSDCCYSP